MKRFFTSALFISFCTFASSQTTRTVVGDAGTGWANGNNWSPSGVPGNGDIAVIPAGQTIHVKGGIYVTPPTVTVRINGTLDFDPSGKLEFASGSSIQIYSTGQILSDNNNSELITINGITKFQGGTDPSPLTGPRYASATTSTSPSGFSTGVLPIKLAAFTVQKLTSTVLLKWSSAEEINASHFVVERSGDARSWQSLGRVNCTGDAADYSWNDATPLKGNNFYRLNLIDKDGRQEHSLILKLVADKSIGIMLSPIPASSFFTLTLSQQPTTALTVDLYNSNGQLIKTAGFSRTNILKVGLHQVVPGIYTMILRSSAEVLATETILVR